MNHVRQPWAGQGVSPGEFRLRGAFGKFMTCHCRPRQIRTKQQKLVLEHMLMKNETPPLGGGGQDKLKADD
jgi:hypothetical protein